jgi:uncharacterized membrane protein
MELFQSIGAPVDKAICAPSQKVAVLMLLTAAFFWGSGNVANKTVLQDMDPVAAVVARNLVAAAALLPFALRDIIKVTSRAAWIKSAFLPSALFAGAVMTQQWGYQTASVTNASFLVNVACVLTPLIAFLLLRENLGPNIAVAAILTLIGAFLLSGAGECRRYGVPCVGGVLRWMDGRPVTARNGSRQAAGNYISALLTDHGFRRRPSVVLCTHTARHIGRRAARSAVPWAVFNCCCLWVDRRRAGTGFRLDRSGAGSSGKFVWRGRGDIGAG